MLTSRGGGYPSSVPQSLPKNLFRFGEITLYSTHAFGSTAAAGQSLANSTNRTFVTQLGGQGQGFGSALTQSETNLKEAGRIPSGQAYDVFGVAGQVFSWDPNADNFNGTITDASLASSGLATVVNNGVLAWDFTQTKVFISPLMLAGAGGGIFGAVADSAGNQVRFPEQRQRRHLHVPQEPRRPARFLDLRRRDPVRLPRWHPAAERGYRYPHLPARLLQERHRDRLIISAASASAIATSRPRHISTVWRGFPFGT